MIGASCAASGADEVDASGDADCEAIALSEAAGVGVTVVDSSLFDEPFAITATAKITIPRITANITLLDELAEVLFVFIGAEYEDDAAAGFGVVEMVETEEREPLTGTDGTLYVEDFLVVRLADFFETFLADFRALDFFADARLADFLAVFFGALRAVFFAATYLLLILYLYCAYIPIDRLSFSKLPRYKDTSAFTDGCSRFSPSHPLPAHDG